MVEAQQRIIATQCSSTIPPLRKDGTWIEDSKAKADLFAATFDSKSQLPPEVGGTPFFSRPGEEFEGFIA